MLDSNQANKNLKKLKKAVLVLPGISGKIFSIQLYRKLANELRRNDFEPCLCDFWDNEKELEQLSIEEIHHFLDRKIRFLKKKGYQEIYAIGKSFGGAILLTYHHPSISKVIVWAPAINVGKDSNLGKVKQQKISQLKHFNEIKINQKDLEKIKYDLLLIHGTEDTIVSPENSRKIIKLRKNTVLKEIQGGDHSYREKKLEQEVILETIKFLKIKSPSI